MKNKKPTDGGAPSFESKWKFPPGYTPTGWECTAKRRDGYRCCKVARKGRDKCHNHGGATPVKHGLHSKYRKTRLGEQIQRLKEDPELLSLDEEIAIARALRNEVLDRLSLDLEEGKAGLLTRKFMDGEVSVSPLSLDATEALMRLTTQLAVLVEKRTKKGMTPENMVPVEVVLKLVDGFANALNRIIDSEAIRRRVLIEATRGLDLGEAVVTH